MLLREFVYFNETDSEEQENPRYDPSSDKTILDVNSTRKTRLTLKMINKLRLAGEARSKEMAEDQALIKKMYQAPAPEGMPTI